jgi:hypothetical protein
MEKEKKGVNGFELLSVQLRWLNASAMKISRDLHLIRNKLYEQETDKEYLKKILSRDFSEDLDIINKSAGDDILNAFNISKLPEKIVE